MLAVALVALSCTRGPVDVPDAGESPDGGSPLDCCVDPDCPAAEAIDCACKGCSNSQVCGSGACRPLPQPFAYCVAVQPTPSSCARLVEHLRVDVQSVCTVDLSPSGCYRRIEALPDGGATAQLVIETPWGWRATSVTQLQLTPLMNAQLSQLRQLVACDTLMPGEVCLTRQPFIRVHEVGPDGGAVELLSFDLGATPRPGRAVYEGLLMLQQVSMPIWRDAGLGYVP